jgi:hypothetical protein
VRYAALIIIIITIYQIQFESINLGRVPCQWRVIVHPQTAGQSTHVRDWAAAIHLSCVVVRSMTQPQHLKAGAGGGLGVC